MGGREREGGGGEESSIFSTMVSVGTGVYLRFDGELDNRYMTRKLYSFLDKTARASFADTCIREIMINVNDAYDARIEVILSR